MAQLKSLHTEAVPGDDVNSRRVLIGTITLSGLLMAVSAYFLTVLFQQPPTTINRIALAVFTSVIVASAAGIVLSIRKRQLLGLSVVFIATNMIGLIAAALFIGRTLPASLSIAAISMIIILWVMPGQMRQRYAVGAAMVFALTWLIEFTSPPWRIELATATVGPAAAVVFVIVMIAITARQAWGGNIRIKIITSFTMIALISVTILGTVVYINYRNQVREDMRQRLLNIISITALQQNADLHATIKAAAEENQGAAYQQMVAGNEAILATDPDLEYIYTIRLNEQGQLYFVLDASLDPTYEYVEVGTIYDDPSDLLAENIATLDHPIVEEDFYTDIYGTFLSAYAPIYRSDGTREAIIGVDIVADKVIAGERVILYQILGTTLLTMLLITLIGIWLGNLFVDPVIRLSQTAQKIAEGDLNARAQVQTSDEVGGLAITINAMTSRLQTTLQGLERRVAERTRNLELAADVGREISQVRDLDIMLKDACEIILKEFDLYYVQVYLTDPSASTLRLEAGTGSVGAELLGRRHSLPFDTSSINGRAAVEKHSIVIADTSQSASFRKNPLLPETRGEMAVPLIIADRVVGVLDMQSSQPDVLTNDILPAFEALAGQLAVAIQNANLVSEIEETRAQVEAQARRLIRAGWEEHLDAIHKPEHFGFVFEQDTVTPLSELEEHPSHGGKAISVPIAVTGEPLGSLVVELEDDAKAEQTGELAEIIARQVAQQIENLRLLESAERFRAEAERAARLQTVEGWKRYIETRPASMSFLYDKKEVRPVDDSTKNGAYFAMPLKVRDEFIGRLLVEDVDREDQDAVELVDAVAARLSTHVENLRLFEETKQGQIELDKRARQLAAVAEVSTLSSKELDIQKMLESVVFLTQRKFDLYHAHIFIYDEKTSLLEIRACGWQEGDEHEGTHGTTVIPLEQEQSLVARAARSRQAVIVNDVHNEPGWLANPLLPDTQSELAVPMFIGDQLLGVLDVQSDRLNAFTEEDANIQTTLASQVATALENARSFARAQKQAERESRLNTISQKIQSATTVEAVLQIAARELGHALGAPMTIAQLSMKDGK